MPTGPPTCVVTTPPVLVVLGADDDELEKLAVDDELELIVAAFDDELELVVVAGVDDALLDEVVTLPPPAVPLAAELSILSQLRLNPPVMEMTLKVCVPAVRVILRLTSIQFCQPPVLGTETVSKATPVSASLREKLPPQLLLATRYVTV